MEYHQIGFLYLCCVQLILCNDLNNVTNSLLIAFSYKFLQKVKDVLTSLIEKKC